MAKNNIIDVGFKKKVQKVRLGGLDFEIKEGEKNRKKYLAALPELESRLEKLEKEYDKAIEDKEYEKAQEINDKAKEVVKDTTDLILGDGAFDQLYEVAEEDTEVIVEGLTEVLKQYKAGQEKKKAQRYLDRKNKK